MLTKSGICWHTGGAVAFAAGLGGVGYVESVSVAQALALRPRGGGVAMTATAVATLMLGFDAWCALHGRGAAPLSHPCIATPACPATK